MTKKEEIKAELMFCVVSVQVSKLSNLEIYGRGYLAAHTANYCKRMHANGV